MLRLFYDESLFAWCHKSLLAWLETVFCSFFKSLPSFVCSEVFKLKHSSRMSIKHQLFCMLWKAFLFNLPKSTKQMYKNVWDSIPFGPYQTDSRDKIIWLELVLLQLFHMSYFWFFWKLRVGSRLWTFHAKQFTNYHISSSDMNVSR